ncbi:hypothetical protein H112_08932 [Trichophyton rubrum D6]|uniref:Uncharacterized protein n=3 Tax=Trichophyton TaxID=5550 RepID=A0A080WR15_TRIRC|nr:uncharacterized protein TERG_11722 [Trichophyton rubrum CBS 118892]EZF09638.1 hypothetical protein H100_08954 [Trichophyton rubrum MR850]EZF36564.1 hypothetical protein H102_08912 [Trichophyton rubrum CBS 100081]EZF47146.1 hypothetical protein H103_08936 [Trichophyton rubrum CBS 288.86]EZF57828.1 hypothetical protein H104_08884 [Trichophyton rubrum CBS 289.86]EZF68414.1 hypothetical protein H105_08939 [Trichophyton soudanense CBS 452.61]EZF79117.1 hypothetical protein H110_08935 [Trichophy
MMLIALPLLSNLLLSGAGGPLKRSPCNGRLPVFLPQNTTTIFVASWGSSSLLLLLLLLSLIIYSVHLPTPFYASLFRSFVSCCFIFFHGLSPPEFHVIVACLSQHAPYRHKKSIDAADEDKTKRIEDGMT